MENYTAILLILAIMIVASGFAGKAGFPAPVFLIALGIAVGFVPFLPEVSLNSEVVMLIFLPPLLYDAAFNISPADFKAQLNTIGTLAVGLVFLTTAGIAVTARYLVPGMGWPEAFVLGSILSATDAVAAIGITRGLGLPKKTITILEGESLVNDASALVAYRFAVAAVTGAAFVWWKAPGSFAVVFGGGFLIGFVVGQGLAHVLRYFRTNGLVVLSLMLLMPFATYLLAEHFRVSGVVAVVVLGWGMAMLSRGKFPERLKEQSQGFWSVITFLLNGLIFILIGLQFPIVLRRMGAAEIPAYIGYACVIALVAFAIRFVRVFWQQLALLKAFQGGGKDPRGRPRVRKEALLDTGTSVILGWSGMRGIVSLAIALGLPATLESGAPFPMRNEIVFISIAVVLFSLLGQGLSLPWVVRKFSGKPE